MEIWDAYDSEKQKLSIDLVREEIVPAGMYHIAVHIVVKNRNGSYLAMQRDFNKPGFPGLFEVSAGGSILKGETDSEGAIRELFEETGIKVDDLVILDELHEVRHPCIYEVFLADVDVDEDAIILQEGETVGYKWVAQREIYEFVNSEMHVGSNARKRINKALELIERKLSKEWSKGDENISK